jgi:hypothetical protein
MLVAGYWILEEVPKVSKVEPPKQENLNTEKHPARRLLKNAQIQGARNPEE